MARIIYVQQASTGIKHIKDDSGRLHWDLLCAHRQNKAGSWSTGDISDVNCPRCLTIFADQNKVLESHGLNRADAKLLSAGLSEHMNIQRNRVQHLIDNGIFTGNPASVGWWENGEWLTKLIGNDWTRCELTKKGDEIAMGIWKTPYAFNIGDRVMVEFGTGIITSIDPSYPNGMPIIVTHDDSKGRGAYRCDEIEFLDSK